MLCMTMEKLVEPHFPYTVKPALYATCLEAPPAIKRHLSKVPLRLTCLEPTQPNAIALGSPANNITCQTTASCDDLIEDLLT